MKRVTTEYIDQIGHVGAVTRRTIQLAEVQNTNISMFKYETAIEDTITKVNQRIEAETESCDDALLLSSMCCESFFLDYLATVKISERNDQSASFSVDNGQCDAQAIGSD